MYDLELDPMTLINKLDLDTMEMYLSTTNKVSRSNLSKVTAGTADRQTDMTKYIAALHYYDNRK